MHYRFRRHYATRKVHWLFPALKGRAKVIPTLRVEEFVQIYLKDKAQVLSSKLKVLSSKYQHPETYASHTNSQDQYFRSSGRHRRFAVANAADAVCAGFRNVCGIRRDRDWARSADVRRDGQTGRHSG